MFRTRALLVIAVLPVAALGSQLQARQVRPSSTSPSAEARLIAAELHGLLDTFYICVRIDRTNTVLLHCLANGAEATKKEASTLYAHTGASRYRVLRDAADAATRGIRGTARLVETASGRGTQHDKDAISGVIAAKDGLRRAGFPFRPLARWPQPRTEAAKEARARYIQEAHVAVERLQRLRVYASGTDEQFGADALEARSSINEFLRHEPFDWAPPSRDLIERAMGAFEVGQKARGAIWLGTLADSVSDGEGRYGDKIIGLHFEALVLGDAFLQFTDALLSRLRY